MKSMFRIWTLEFGVQNGEQKFGFRAQDLGPLDLIQALWALGPTGPEAPSGPQTNRLFGLSVTLLGSTD